MKIIAKTECGYLVEATDIELLNAAGHEHWEADKLLGRHPIGRTIVVTATHNYLKTLRGKEETLRAAAEQFRAMATFMEQSLPTTIIPQDDIQRPGD